MERDDVPAAIWAAATLIPGLRGAGKRVFKIPEHGFPNAAIREVTTPPGSPAPATLPHVSNDLSSPGTTEPPRLSKSGFAPRQAEAFASVIAARKRITEAGLDRFTGRADSPEVLAAIKTGTATRLRTLIIATREQFTAANQAHLDRVATLQEMLTRQFLASQNDEGIG